MNFNDAWQEIISISPNSPDFYIELSYRRIQVEGETTTECVLYNDYSGKVIEAPTFRACIDEYKIFLGIPTISNDIVEETAK